MDPWQFWRQKIASPKLILAPMVDHSELPWRMLSREYDCDAAYTPMFHANQFANSKKYRQRNFSTCHEDRPLFVQFCANNAEDLTAAARYVENDCDGIDLNLGCPQENNCEDKRNESPVEDSIPIDIDLSQFKDPEDCEEDSTNQTSARIVIPSRISAIEDPSTISKPIISKSGRIMRGRGTFKFRTPSPEASNRDQRQNYNRDHTHRSSDRSREWRRSPYKYSTRRNRHDSRDKSHNSRRHER